MIFSGPIIAAWDLDASGKARFGRANGSAGVSDPAARIAHGFQRGVTGHRDVIVNVGAGGAISPLRVESGVASTDVL